MKVYRVQAPAIGRFRKPGIVTDRTGAPVDFASQSQAQGMADHMNANSGRTGWKVVVVHCARVTSVMMGGRKVA